MRIRTTEVQLGALSFEACDLRDLSLVRRFPALYNLSVWCSPLTDISAVAGHPALARLDFRGCLIEDASPLLEAPELYNVQLGGNPLDERSYREVLPALLALRGKTEMVGDAGADPEHEWLMMQWMKEQCLALGAMRAAGRTLLINPTLPYRRSALGGDWDTLKRLWDDPAVPRDTAGFFEALRQGTQA